MTEGTHEITQENAALELIGLRGTPDSANVDKCSWPGCIYGNGSIRNPPKPERCPTRECKKTLHHSCEVEWISNNGFPEYNLKRCYDCWSKEKCLHEVM